MKSLFLSALIAFSTASFAQWTHAGEEPSNAVDCNTYHYFEIPECAEVTKVRMGEMERDFALVEAKRKLVESDPKYIVNLREFEGCESVDVKSKLLPKMNQAELCRRQLMEELEESGYFKELEANF